MSDDLKERLTEEATELKRKCDKLSALLTFCGPHEGDEIVRLLLCRQLGHMEEYLSVLEERIELSNK